MAMCLSGLDLGVICGLDEREIFLAVVPWLTWDFFEDAAS
jgi:hypothetical protein